MEEKGKVLEAYVNGILEWFNLNRGRLDRGGLWMDGGEPGRVSPERFDSAGLRILICRLSSYQDVLHSVTHRLLYWAANRVPGVYADLAFLPPSVDMTYLRKQRVPWWLASGCKRPPQDFDIVAISISVQQEAMNFPLVLEYSGIRLSHEERMQHRDQPLVILGGNAAHSVPFIHGRLGENRGSGLVDLVCIGDGVEWTTKILEMVRDRLGSRSYADMPPEERESLLREIAIGVPGSYVPSLYVHGEERGVTTSISAIDAFVPQRCEFRLDSPQTWLSGYDGAYIPFSEEDFEETLPVSRGCPFRCSFCQTGWLGSNPGPVDTGAMADCAMRIRRATACADINLLTADAASAKGIPELVAHLHSHRIRASLKSLTVAGLAGSPAMRQLAADTGKREFTFGVEGISSRLRRYLGKSFETGLLLDLVRDLDSRGLRQLKLFFILTGLEESDDTDEFSTFIRAVRRNAPKTNLVASFTPLFSAPFTPLQFDRMREVDYDVSRLCHEAVKSCAGQFRLSSSRGEIRLMNLFCRAGRSATAALVQLSLKREFTYREAIPDRAVDEGEKLLVRAGVDIGALESEKTDQAVFPWDDLKGCEEKAAIFRKYSEISAAFRKAPAAARGARVVTPSVRGKEPANAGSQAGPNLIRHVVMLPDSDAWRPGVTVARGILRSVFLSRPELADLYVGQPAIMRLNGMAGLAILSAAFAAPETVLPVAGGAENCILARLEGDGIEAESLLWLIRVAVRVSQHPHGYAGGGLGPFDGLLKKRAIPFQAIRRKAGLSLIVSEKHRRRIGIHAVWEDPAHGVLALCGWNLFRFNGVEGEQIFQPGRALAIIREVSGKCSQCGSPAMKTLHATADAPVIGVCIDCSIARKT